MKRYLKLLLTAITLTIFVFCLCSCGESGLQKAYDSLAKVAGAAEDTYHSAGKPLQIKYEEDQDFLYIQMTHEADLDAIFTALNEAIDGQDIGTIVFAMTGTWGDGFEAKVDQKISELSCNSMERLGLNYYILNAETHHWTALASKTDKLYIDGGMPIFKMYKGTDRTNLKKFKDVQWVYVDSNIEFDGVQRLKGMETLSFVPGYEILEESDNEDITLAISPGSNGGANSENPAEQGTEQETETVAALPFSYNFWNDREPEKLAKAKSLKTLLIYPQTGYTLENTGETFIKSLQYIKPDLLVNAPGEGPYSGNTVGIKDIKTANVSAESARGILQDLLEKEVKKTYNECKKYKSSSKTPVLTGKCLVYHADPLEDDWSTSRKYSYNGEVVLKGLQKRGIKKPSSIGDYQTFVYIYPTYTKTGNYDNGVTGAYSQTLNVQVFNMKKKVAYKASSVGTAPAPQRFSYFAGSVPKKHSGEVKRSKALKYLKGLKKVSGQ